LRMVEIMTPGAPTRSRPGPFWPPQGLVFGGLIFVDCKVKRSIFRSLGQEWPGLSPVEGTPVNKAGKRSREKFDTAELFTDDEFDAEDFVEQMDDKHHHKAGAAKTGWRRLEQLREEQQLREQLRELGDWDDGADF
jgi:hypothetical protein